MEGIKEREVTFVWVMVLVALLLGGGLVSINRGLSWVVFLKLELRYISFSLLGALHIGGEVCRVESWGGKILEVEGKTIEGVLDLLGRYPVDRELSLIRGSWWWEEFNVSRLRVWFHVVWDVMSSWTKLIRSLSSSLLMSSPLV